MNGKASTLLSALDGLPEGATVVEIGCVRFPGEIASDGWSTYYLAQAATDRGWALHSVDIDPGAVEHARTAADGLACTVHHADGASWLAAFPDAIDGLYLDGSADPGEAVEQYRAATLTASPVVVIDDVQRIGDQQRGKANLLLDVLADDGFDVRVVGTEPGYLMAVAHRSARRGS